MPGRAFLLSAGLREARLAETVRLIQLPPVGGLFVGRGPTWPASPCGRYDAGWLTWPTSARALTVRVSFQKSSAFVA